MKKTYIIQPASREDYISIEKDCISFGYEIISREPIEDEEGCIGFFEVRCTEDDLDTLMQEAQFDSYEQ